MENMGMVLQALLGGEAYLIDNVRVLLPWIALLAAIMAGGAMTVRGVAGLRARI